MLLDEAVPAEAERGTNVGRQGAALSRTSSSTQIDSAVDADATFEP